MDKIGTIRVGTGEFYPVYLEDGTIVPPCPAGHVHRDNTGIDYIVLVRSRYSVAARVPAKQWNQLYLAVINAAEGTCYTEMKQVPKEAIAANYEKLTAHCYDPSEVSLNDLHNAGELI